MKEKLWRDLPVNPVTIQKPGKIQGQIDVQNIGGRSNWEDIFIKILPGYFRQEDAWEKSFHDLFSCANECDRICDFIENIQKGAELSQKKD